MIKRKVVLMVFTPFFCIFLHYELDHITSKKRRIRYARAKLQKLSPYTRPRGGGGHGGELYARHGSLEAPDGGRVIRNTSSGRGLEVTLYTRGQRARSAYAEH